MSRISRKTKQKEELGKVSKEFKSFFSAKDFAKKANVAQATVYRFLKSQVSVGSLFSYRCNGKTIYSSKRRSHCHFICEKTGEVIHFDVDSIDFLKNKIPGKIESFQIEVRGLCESEEDEK